jgi:disulfide bond formation protein DsbB
VRSLGKRITPQGVREFESRPLRMKKILLFIAFFQSLIAMLGSLFFSEVMKFPPCVLCWYQRICMYPLVVILFVGLITKDKKVFRYVLLLSITGLIISLYHNLLYYGVISEGFQPCTVGVPCTTKFFSWFGFITIPLLSLTAFIVINICMVLFIIINRDKSQGK